MTTTLDLHQLPDNRTKQVTARAQAEFRQHQDVFERQGVTEAAYIRSRLVDEGLATVSPPEPRPATPAWQRVPGLVPMNPSGTEVGSRD